MEAFSHVSGQEKWHWLPGVVPQSRQKEARTVSTRNRQKQVENALLSVMLLR